jgi:hypothetical protein
MSEDHMANRSRWLLAAGLAVLPLLVLVIRHTTTVRAQGSVLWFADHEGPGEANWYYPPGSNFGGGELNSGCAGTTFTAYDNDPSTPNVVPPPGGGSFGLELRMTAPCGTETVSGTRLFRWKEPREHPDLSYKVWYYFPRNYRLVGNPGSAFWNIFGWKSKTIDPPQNEVFWHVNVYNRPSDGSMFLQLRDAQRGEAPAPLATINVPVNQWFYLEAYYESRETASGRITIWQGDGENRTLLWDLAGVQTRFPGGWTEWYVSNYSSGLDVQPAFIGIDNAEIRLP